MEGESRVGRQQLEHLLLMRLAAHEFPDEALFFLRIMMHYHHVAIEARLERETAGAKAANVAQAALLVGGAAHVDGHGDLLLFPFPQFLPGEIGHGGDLVHVAIELGQQLFRAEIKIKTAALVEMLVDGPEAVLDGRLLLARGGWRWFRGDVSFLLRFRGDFLGGGFLPAANETCSEGEGGD